MVDGVKSDLEFIAQSCHQVTAPSWALASLVQKISLLGNIKD